MPIGDWLRDERKRLGLSQPAFAELAGTTKQTLFSWETGKTAPDAFQLAAFANAGVDVRYVITGRRDGPAPVVLSAEEQTMVAYMRESTPQLRKAALAVFLSGSEGGGNYSQQNSGNNAVQIGAYGGKVKIIKGG